MVSPDPTINLIEKVWSPKEFQEHKFTVLESTTSQVAYERINPLITLALLRYNGGKEATQYTMGDDDPESRSGIFKVSSALDDIATRELNLQISAFREHDIKKNPQERFTKIQECLANLINVCHNLENHNKVIEEFNSRFSTDCPTHIRTIEKIQAEIQKLRQIEFKIGKEMRSTKEENTSVLDENLTLLQEEIKNGMIQDENTILERYSSFLPSIDDLHGKVQKDVKARLNTLLNQSYLSILPKQFPVLGLVKNLGMLAKFEREMPRFIEHMQNQFASQDVLATLEPPDFIVIVQQKAMEFLSSEVLELPREQMIPLLHDLHQFELELSTRLKIAEENARQDSLESLENLFKKDDLKAIAREKIQNYQFSSPISQPLQNVFEKAQFDFRKDLNNPEKVQKLKVKLESALRYWSVSQIYRKLYLQIQKFLLETNFKN